MNNIDPSELKIMDYLYGEMNEEEKREFEAELEKNQELRSKVDAIQGVQGSLGIWNNESISIPEFEEQGAAPKATVEHRPLKTRMPKFSNVWMKYAAIFLGLIAFLQFSGLQVSTQGNALMLSFGEPQTSQFDGSDVDAIVEHAIAKYAKSQQNEFVAFKQEVNSNFDDINTAFTSLTSDNQTNVMRLQGIFDQNLKQQYVSLQSMINEIEDNQRMELEDSFTGMIEFIENNRQKDQFRIQNAFNELATALDNQQYQTNALLTSISTEENSLKSY